MNDNFEYLSEMERSLDPLDLAFLFLDGEANDIEKQVLFEALSNDVNLQNDFQEAIAMKYAGIEDVKDLTPPVGLTNAVYSSIGIGAATTVSNLANNFSGNYFTGLFNSASSFLSPIYMVITSFILGSLISYFLIQNIDNNQNQNNQSNQNKQNNQYNQKLIPITKISETKNISNIDTIKTNNLIQNNDIDEQKLSQKGNFQNLTNEKIKNELVEVYQYKRNKLNPEIIEIDTLYYTKEKVNKLREEQKKLHKNDIASNVYKSKITTSKIDSTNSTMIVLNNGVNGKNNINNNNKYIMPILTPNENIDYKIQTITPIQTNEKMNIMPFENSIFNKNMLKYDSTNKILSETTIENGQISKIVIQPENITVENTKLENMQNVSQNYEIKINTINTLNYFQNMSEKSDNTSSFNNLQGTILYKISENQKVGLSIGNEDYPRYVQLNSEFILTNGLTYYGGVYNYNFLDINLAGNIKTNINLLLGMSSNSLVNKSGIEINWKPDSKLTINFGVESLLNVANFNNAYEYTGKMNLFYGVSYSF